MTLFGKVIAEKNPLPAIKKTALGERPFIESVSSKDYAGEGEPSG